MAVHLVILYIFLALCFMYMVKQLRRTGTSLPGPHGLFLLGNTLEFSLFDMKHNVLLLQKYAKQYGDIFTVIVMGQRWVCLNSPDVVRDLFFASPLSEITSDRPPMFYARHFFKGAESPAFHDYTTIQKNLKRGIIRGLRVYGDGVKALEETVMKEVCEVMERIERHQGRAFEFVSEISTSIASIISVLLLGEPFQTVEEADLFIKYTYSADILLKPSIDGPLFMIPVLRFVPGYFRKVCQTHENLQAELLEKFFYSSKKSYKSGKIRGLVDYFLSEQETAIREGQNVIFTDERIQTCIMDIIGAANVTSRPSLSAMFLCLINYPEYQARLYAEINDVIGKDRLPTLEDRPSCPFLEAFSLELHRYISIGPYLVPHYCRSKFIYKGYTIPENTMIIGNAWFIHHDENIWDDPWQFRPERFLDSEGQLLEKEHPLRQSWIPFGIGKRRCLGENFARSRLFLFLAAFLQRWQFLPPEGVEFNPRSCDPREDGFETNAATAAKPFHCRVVKRN